MSTSKYPTGPIPFRGAMTASLTAACRQAATPPSGNDYKDFTNASSAHVGFTPALLHYASNRRDISRIEFVEGPETAVGVTRGAAFSRVHAVPII